MCCSVFIIFLQLALFTGTTVKVVRFILYLLPPWARATRRSWSRGPPSPSLSSPRPCVCPHSVLVRGIDAEPLSGLPNTENTESLSPVPYPRFCCKVDLVQCRHLSLIFLSTEFRKSVLPRHRDNCSHFHNVKVSRNLHCALWHSLMHWGRGRGFPSPPSEACLFIYLFEMNPCCLKSFPPSEIIAVALDGSICCRGDVPTSFVGASLLQ